MKALAILFRVVFSVIVLLTLALYLQVSPTITLGQFCDSLTPESLSSMLCVVNTVTVSLGIIVLLGIFSCTRILEAAWNVLFSASILFLLAGGLYAAFGPAIALPNAIYHNESINQLCQALPSYQVGVAIVALIFIAGWLCASASVRVAITAVVSYGLWYGITEFFSYVVYLWANSSEPAMPEALNMIQGTPWVIAAVPAAFFLIYALLMAFFETFINHGSSKRTKPADAPKAEAKLEVKPADAPKTDAKPVEKPADAPKAEAKPEEKPADAPKADAKPEEKPADAPEAADKDSNN